MRAQGSRYQDRVKRPDSEKKVIAITYQENKAQSSFHASGRGTVTVSGEQYLDMNGQLLMPRSMVMGMLQERHDATNPTK